MKVIFSKKSIKNLHLAEGRDYKVYKKKSLKLMESGNEDTSYASDSSDLADAISDSLTKDAVINKGNTDGEYSTKPTTINIDAKNTSDAQRQIQQNNKDPKLKALGNNVNYKVHVESLNRVDSVPFTKKELNEMLNN